MTPEQRAGLSQVGLAAGLGCTVVVSLILCIGGGVALDRALDTTPILTLVGVALGLIAAGYQLYELAQVGRVDRPAPPLSRALERVPLPRAARSHEPGRAARPVDRRRREGE